MSFWEKVKSKIPRIPDIKFESTGFKLNINFHIGEKHYHFETKEDAKILKPAHVPIDARKCSKGEGAEPSPPYFSGWSV